MQALIEVADSKGMAEGGRRLRRKAMSKVVEGKQPCFTWYLEPCPTKVKFEQCSNQVRLPVILPMKFSKQYVLRKSCTLETLLPVCPGFRCGVSAVCRTASVRKHI